MIFLTALLVLGQDGSAQTPQEPEPQARPQPGQRPPENLLDRIEIIVNDDVIRYREIGREAQRTASGREITTSQDVAMLYSEVTSKLVENMLRRQAGQDLGLDPKLIQLQVQGHTDRFIESAGSVLEASEILKRADLDSAEATEMWEGQLYNLVWEESVTGRGPGASGRQVRDRYVRPGQIAARYREYVNPVPWLPRRNPEEIGGEDARYVLQEFIASGLSIGMEDAFAICKEAHQAALDGVEFEELHARYSGGVRTPGAPAPWDEQSHSVMRIADAYPDMAGWIENRAEPDSISPIFPIVFQGQPAGYRFVRYVRTVPAELPALNDPGTQDRIRKLLLKETDDLRINESLNGLFEKAYVWPEELGRRN